MNNNGYKVKDYKQPVKRYVQTLELKNDPPTIIFHGTDDNVVPCCQGQELYDELTKAGVKSSVTIVPGGGHGMNMYGEENLTKMVNFLNEVRAAKK